MDECLCIDPDDNASTDQRLVLQAIDEGHTDIAIKSGHGTGKTTLLSWVIIWVGLFKLDSKIPCTAPTAPQLVRLLIPEVRKWREKMPNELKGAITVKNDSVAFTGGNQAIARTARKEAPEGLQGFHATWLVWIIDEASGISMPIFEVIDGSLTGEHHLRLMTGNPTRPDGYFFDAFNRMRKLWKRFTFNAENSENVSKASVEKKLQQYGGKDTDAYRVRVLGEFPRSSTSAIIPMFIIEDAIIREDYNNANAEVWGVDYADAGDDKTILVKRIGNFFYEKMECPVTGVHRQAQTAAWLALQFKLAKRKPRSIFIDGIGEGSGLVSVLRMPHYSYIPAVSVKVSNSAVDKEIYFNLRTELYYKLKEALEDEGKMFDDEDAIGELSAQRFEFSERGQLKAIKKDLIKEELGRSPDISDAMALTCYTSIPAELIAVDPLHDPEFMDMDGNAFDPFEDAGGDSW